MYAGAVAFQGIDVTKASAGLEELGEERLVIRVEMERSDLRMGWQVSGVGGADDGRSHAGPVEHYANGDAGYIRGFLPCDSA